MKKNFYDIVAILDKYKQYPRQADFEKLNKIIGGDEEYERYFFVSLDNEKWFDIFWENKLLPKIPNPEFIDDGKNIRFSPWWFGIYLIKVANKIPDKVLSLIEQVKTENQSAIDDCDRAILNMPDQFISDNHERILVLYDNWLDAKYIGIIKYDIVNLFNKLIKTSCYDGAIKLLNILSKVKLEKGDVKFRFDAHYYQEIKKKYLPELIEHKPSEVLTIIETSLREAIKLELDADQEDHSILWRPAIEDSSQNFELDEPKDILSEVLRDILQKTIQVHPEDIRKAIERYLQEGYSIFNRLAIHCIRVSNLHDLTATVILDKNNLDKTEIRNEFDKLVKEKFGVLTKEQKKRFILNILEVPPPGGVANDEKYRRYCQAKRLQMIKKHLEIDGDIKEFKYLLDEHKDELIGIQQTEYINSQKPLIGPTSSLTKNEMLQMSPEQFINWIKTNLQPPYEIMRPTPEGVARIFQEVVIEKADIYAKEAEKFIDENIYPAYLVSLIYGFGGAVSADKKIDLEPIIKFIENPLKFHPEPKVESRFGTFDIGQYQWLRGAIANFIEAMTAKNTFPLTIDIMDRTQTVLVELIEKDEYPTEESEKKYGPEANNMDYVNYCINSNRGKAMYALMQHAWRRARMRVSEEEKKKEEGKGPFPPGKRMDEYKDFFEKRLDVERSPSVQSSYGRFLPNLCYLDQDWVRLMIKNGKLFPNGNERSHFWEAHWQGYIGFQGLYNPLYSWLKYDYDKAVDHLIKDGTKKEKHKRYDDRLAEHLMVAYWRGLEDLRPGEILDKFFKNSPSSIRGHAIGFLGRVLTVTVKIDSCEWKRLKDLWKYRIKNCKDNELCNFAKWLKNCPDKIEDIVQLIKPILPYVLKYFYGRDLLEYLNDKVESNPLICLELLNDLLSIKEKSNDLFLDFDLIKKIITTGYFFRGDKKISFLINAIINHLGELGYYDFRDLLIK